MKRKFDNYIDIIEVITNAVELTKNMLYIETVIYAVINKALKVWMR